MQPLKDIHLIQLYQYWAGQVGTDGALPGREVFDAANIGPALLPWVVLHDVVEQPHGPYGRRYYYRLVGTEVVATFGFDPTGRYADEVGDTEMVRQVHAYMDEAVTTRRAHVSHTATMAPHKEYIRTERLILPLGGPDGSVTKLIVVPLVVARG
ncbi:PAS domain-containing protein [Ferrovibrio sp.]|uniref:PAS domain-containing protein n=1 Tax=Ferrovibrio sp. TaxID=1917215 RepID=UPI001B74E899|nr:PAS domain-containing protein [Ferrovibrio sp.]MBP7065659.1 PAS domain-containing protein [Ferrovibrio sp.]